MTGPQDRYYAHAAEGAAEYDRLRTQNTRLLEVLMLFACKCWDNRLWCYLHDREFRASVDAVPGERKSKHMHALKAAYTVIEEMERT